MQLPYAAINAGGYASGRFHNVQQKRSIIKGYESNLRYLEHVLNEESPFAWQLIDELNQMIDVNPEASIPTLVATLSEGSDATLSEGPELSDATKDAMVTYGLSYLAYSGLNKAKTEEIETAAQEASALIEENANPDTGSLMTAIVSGFDVPVHITGGDVKFHEDGSVDRENSAETTYIIHPETGEKLPYSTKFVESRVEDIPVADAIAQATELATAPIIAQQENEEVRPYEIGEMVRATDGIMGEITGIDEVGNYILSAPTPMGMTQVVVEPRQIINEDNLRGVENGSVVVYLDANDNMVEGVVEDMHSDRANGMAFIDGNLIPTSNIVGLASEVNKAQQSIRQPIQEESTEQEPEWDELPQIPVDKEGNPDFNQMTPLMLGSQIEQLTGSRDMAYDMLSGMLEENQKEQQKQIEKLPKKASELNKFATERKRLQNEGLRLERALSQYSDIAETRSNQQEIETIRKEIAGPDMESLSNREFIRQAYPDGAPNVYMQVLFDIINGQRFAWNNQGNKRGIAEELGKTGENGHRQSYFGILASPENGGISFDDYVHTIYTDGGWDLDDTEIRDQVIEALNDAHSPGEAANRVREIYSKSRVDLNEIADYYEDRAAYESEQGEINNPHSSEFDTSDYVGRVLFHGSPDGKLDFIDPYAHTQNWREGIGFYTTENPDAAQQYANGRTAGRNRKKGAGEITEVVFPEKARILDMDAPADMDLWNGITDELDADRIERAETNMDAYREMVISLGESLGSMEGQYAIEEALLNHGFDGSTHIEGRNSTPHRVFIWKNEFNLPAIQSEIARAESETDTNPTEAQESESDDHVPFQSVKEEWRDGHSAPGMNYETLEDALEDGGDFNLSEVARGFHNQPDDYFDSKVGARYYGYNTPEGKESLTAIDGVVNAIEAGKDPKKLTVTAYRAVPNAVKDEKLRENDWVTFSKQYAVNHGESRFGEGEYRIIEQEVPIRYVWWDGNDINEWGYDDTNESRFQSTKKPHFKPIGKKKLKPLINKLKKSGLAKEVVTDKAKFDARLSEVLDGKGAVMRNKSGSIYGFVADGVVYLDSSRMNANTPVHEFGHLWSSFIKENNSELWARGAELIRESEYWQRVNDNPAYSKLSEEQKIDEALAMAIGDKGEMIVNSGMKQRFLDWLKDVWDSIKAALGVGSDVSIEDMTLTDFTDLAVGELLSGKDLQKSSENAIFVNENNPENGKRAEARLGNRRAMGSSAVRETLGSAEERRRISRTVEAADHGGNASAVRSAEELEELESRGINPNFSKTNFRKTLSEAAKENDLWLDESYLDDKQLMHDQRARGTSENDVYKNPDGKTLTKLNNLSYVVGSEKERNLNALFDRLSSHNELFPNVSYTIRGFVSNKSGFPALAMEQPYVEADRNATQEEIDAYLTSRGFTLSGTRDWSNSHPVWSNGVYELFDARPANVLMGRDGNLYFIDTIPHSVEYMNEDNQSTEMISKQEVSEMEQIKQRSIEDGTFMKAPNGEPTNLTERQWLQVRTSNFKDWFGDWQNDPENASKVVDSNGEPMVVYHATNVDFTEFLNDKIGKYNFLGKGFYFANSKQLAKDFTKKDNLMEVFLNINNPYMAKPTDYGLDVNILQKQAHDGIIRSYGKDSELVAFSPNQIKSATANTGEFSKDTDDIRFQSVGDVANATGSTMTEEMRKELDVKLKNFAFRLREAWEDKHLAVKNFLDLLRKEGVSVAEYNDYYKQATHLNGKIDAQLERYNNQYQKPLNEAIKQLEDEGFEYRDIENYVILKHGLERNEWMRQDAIDKYMESHPDATPEQIERFESRLPDDYSGITGVLTEFLIERYKANNPNGDVERYKLSLPDKMEIEELELMLGETVEDHISGFEQKAGKDLIDNLWARTKDATSFALNKQLEGGLIDKATLEDLSSRYEYYVPLRGHDAETAEDRWDYSPNMGTYFVAPIMKAYGRRSRSESPFAYVASMAQSAINSANRNILNQTILRLARKDLTGLMSANKVWYVESGRDAEGIPSYEAQSPAYSENPEQYRQNIEEFNERMKRLESEGMAYQGRKKLDIGGIFIKRSQEDQHEVHVYQNGEEFVVYINANPAVARAINGSNAKDLHKDLKFIAKVSREMAANFTTRNPIFVASNFSRDYIFASSILGVKEDARYALQFQKNMPKSFDALQRYVRGKADLSKKHDRYLNEYILNGAKTGFSHIVELQRVQKQIERDIKRSGKKTPPVRVALDALAAMNDVAENMSRLSVYITSREQGRSITQSVSDAKEVTVNFNRSGAGGMGSQWVRPLYLFVNAGIQALSNFAKVAVKNPKKASVLISSYAVSGFLMPFFASLLGGEEGEEEYWKLSDWERQNNLCIYTGDGFIKIPLPHELRVFHKMGNEIHQAIFGKKDVTQTMIDTALGFADLIPANPFGAVDGSWAEIMPDALKPVFQLAANTNFTGSRITNEWADPNKPGYLRVRTNKKGEPYAPAFLIKLAEGLDTVTGGDGVKKGIIGMNPDVVNHIMRGYFGGLYGMIMQGLGAVPKTYEWAKTGELKLKVRETPLRTFYTSSDDLLTTSSGLNSRYFKIADDVKEALRREKGYKEQVKDGKLSVVDFGEKIQKLDMPKINQLNVKIKLIRKYESSLKELDGEEQRELERIIANLKGEVVELNKR